MFPRTPLRRFRILLLTVLLAVTGAVLVSPAQAAGAPYCGITWGSLAKSGGDWNRFVGNLTDVRAGRHACFDRLVIDLGTHATSKLGWRVGYGTVHAEGSGHVIPLRGAADLSIQLHAAADDGHHVTFAPRSRSEVVDVRGFDTFRQVAYGGSFEAHSTFGLGVRARLPFRVMTLDGGGPGDSARLVIDVAHRW